MPLRAPTSSWPLRNACSVFTGGTTTSWTCLISSAVRPCFCSQVSRAASRWAPSGVDPDLLADQVAGGPDRAVRLGVEAEEGLGVGAVVVDDGLDRGAGFDELDHRAGEGAAEVGLVGGGGLDVLRAADGVADPLQLDRAEVAEVLREFGQGHGVRAALVAQFQLLGLAGCTAGRRRSAAGQQHHGGGEQGQGFLHGGFVRSGSRRGYGNCSQPTGERSILRVREITPPVHEARDNPVSSGPSGSS